MKTSILCCAFEDDKDHSPLSVVYYMSMNMIAPTLWYEWHGHHLLYDLFLKSDHAEKHDWKFANFAIANLRKKKRMGNLQILQLQI